MTKEEREKRAEVILHAKEEYLAGDESLAALALRWDVPLSTLRARCAKEGWVGLRRARRGAISRGGEDAAPTLAGEDRLSTLMGVSDTLDTLLERSCADMESRGAPIKEIKELTGTLKDAIAIKRELWSIPKNEGDTQITVHMAVPEEYFS